MPAMTRGPLPAAVYWRRRAAVLGILLLLVIGVARMFGGGEDDPAARQASATTSTPPVVPDDVGAVSPTPAPSASAGAVLPSTAAPTTAAPTPAAPTQAPTTALPTPTGRCSDDDVNVTAAVPKAEATRTVWVALSIRTNVQTACLWQLDPKALQVEITSGSDHVWSSIQCPKAIPTKELTLRRDTPVAVGIKWSSRRSDDGCTDHTQWATPGYYHVQAAALGGEPVDVQFKLAKPAPVVAPRPTATASPTAGASTAKTGGKKNPATKGRRSEPTGEPVHPD